MKLLQSYECGGEVSLGDNVGSEHFSVCSPFVNPKLVQSLFLWVLTTPLGVVVGAIYG
jgi:hypothetical protein